MLKDLRHGIRTLLHAKGWTAVVVISLALGIGANTALFSAINGLYLRKLPVKDPDTLVRLRFMGRNDMSTSSSDYGPTRFPGGTPGRATFSFPMYKQLVAEKDGAALGCRRPENTEGMPDGATNPEDSRPGAGASRAGCGSACRVFALFRANSTQCRHCSAIDDG